MSTKPVRPRNKGKSIAPRIYKPSTFAQPVTGSALPQNKIDPALVVLWVFLIIGMTGFGLICYVILFG